MTERTANPGGTCVFHDQYQATLHEISEWRQRAGVKIDVMCKKIDENKEESEQHINRLRSEMKDTVKEIREDFNRGIRRLLYTVVSAVVIQVLIAAFLGGVFK